MIEIFLAIFIFLLTILMTLIGFLGNRMFTRLDEVHKKLVDLCVQHGDRLTRLEVIKDAKITNN